MQIHMLGEVTAFVVGKILDALPAFLLRFVFSPKKVASQIRIRLRDEKPIIPNLNSEVPGVDLYFDITNLSNFNITLDRLLIDLWFGQSTVKGTLLRRFELPARSISKVITFGTDLTQAQCRQITQFLNSQGARGRIHLYVTGYFESKIGVIEVETNFERGGL